MKTIATGIASLLLSLGVLVSPAQSATLKPDAVGQWREPVVAVFVGQALRDDPSWPIADAMAAWSAGPVQLVPVDTRADADIRLQRSNYGKLNGYGGLTAPWVTDGYYTGCRVRVARETYEYSKRALITHEIGHCLGLFDNYAPDAEVSIMSYDDMYGQVGPTAFDLATLAAIYATPPRG